MMVKALLTGLFNALQTKDEDLNRVQYRIRDAFAALAVALTALIPISNLISVANAASLAKVSTEGMPVALAYVGTFGDVFILRPGTVTADGKTVIQSTKPGYEWFRMLLSGAVNARVPAWFIDPSNTTGAASDENNGITATSPLLTWSEHARRLSTAQISTTVTVSVLSDQVTGDTPYYTCEFNGTAAALNFTGTTAAVFTSTVTGYTPCTVGASATDDNSLVDSAVPGGSWTAAGAMAKGLLVRRTSGTVIQCFAMKDKGAQTLRVSQPINNAATTTQPNFAPGDTYEVTRLPLIRSLNLRYPTTAQFPVGVKNFQCSGTDLRAIGKVFWQTVYFTALVAAGAGTYQNCCFNSSSFVFSGNGGVMSFNGGCCFIGTGATRYEFLDAFVNTEGNVVHSQGAQLFVESGSVTANQWNVYDTTISAVSTGVAARIQFLGFLNGSGNTSKMLSAVNASWITFSNASIVNAGSTTDPTPYKASTTVSASPIPLQTNGSGVFQI